MMLALRTLLITVLLFLTTAHQCSPNIFTHKSPLLDSLECYNDYTTYIRCTWEKDPSTPLQIPVIKDEPPCIPEPTSTLPNGNQKVSCIVKKPVFSRYGHEVFFNVSHPSKATLNLNQHGKALPPLNLTEREVRGGSRLLSWSNPYPSSSYPSSSSLAQGLTYQLQYRRHGNDWIVINMNTTEKLIEKQTAGYSYEARVRARCGERPWSDWTPLLSWTVAEEGVLNLQCVLEEKGVSCNWQVKREQANFLSYQLCLGTSKSNMKCKDCACLSQQWERKYDLLDFTCSAISSQPEQLMVEVRSHHSCKEFSDPYNIQPPQPLHIQVNNNNGLWKLTWSRPDVRKSVSINYEVHLQSESPQEREKFFNLTETDFSLDFPASSLLPSTQYRVQIRALPGPSFEGRPSDWSKPLYFTSEPASQLNTIIYILTAVFVAGLCIVLYNMLPACHRKLEVWKVSIPSPFESRILKEMSSKKPPASSLYVSTEKEKTSMCIIQASDNPIIYKGSISTYPLLKYDEDDGDLGTVQSKWTHEPRRLCSYVEGSGKSDRSGISFTGPYILCRQDSSSQTETSSMSFTSLSTLEEDIRSVSESPVKSAPTNIGYVLSPPGSSSNHSTPTDGPANESTEPGQEEILEDKPPTYTPDPVAMPTLTFSHPSGYCVMPNKDMSVAAWVQSSSPPSGGSAEIQMNENADVDSRAREYVTLSQPGT